MMLELQKKLFKEYTNVSHETMNIFQTYLQILTNYQTNVNLIGPGTLNDIWSRHFLDSARLYEPINNWIKRSRLSTPFNLVDVGTGAGFPGIVLSILLQNKYNLKFSVVDSNIKKIRFLKLLRDKLNLNVEIIYSRAEAIEKKFDLIVSRAVANLNKLIDISFPLCKKDTTLMFLKGKKWKAEIKSLKKCWKFKIFVVKNEMSVSKSDGVILVFTNLERS